MVPKTAAKTVKAKRAAKAEMPVVAEQDGGVYLLIADDSYEFQLALQKTAAMAQQNKGHVALLYVIEEQGFLHWKNVEQRIRKEQREEAEKFMWELGYQLSTMSGQIPVLYIEEGQKREVIMATIAGDPQIKMLVLGAGSQSSNPLVSYFTGKGLAELRVPLLVVPDHI